MSADLKESSVPLGEISQGPNAFDVFMEKNQKGIAVAAILLALGAAGLVVQRGMEKNRQEDAGAALVKAEDAKALQSVVDGHKDTRAAGSAMVLLATNQWTEGKKDESIATLRKFIAEFPDHSAVPTAKAGLGSKLMDLGKSADAVKVFDEIIANSAAAYIAPYALICLGDISKEAGDLAKAEASYVKVKQDFPDSNFSETATRRIATLKAKAPVEIAPPPTPVTPEGAPQPMPDGMPSQENLLVPGAAPAPTGMPGLSITPIVDGDAADATLAPEDVEEVEIPADTPPQESPAAPGIEISPEPEAPAKP